MRTVEEHGFAIIPAVVGDGDIVKLLQNISETKMSRSRAGVRHGLKYSVIAQIARDERLLAVAQSVLGCETIPFRATLFDKSSKLNWLVVWHQDTALPLKAKCDRPGWGPWSVKGGVAYAHAPASVLNQVVALRLHLDDSTAKNGPLRVLSATHKMGVLEDGAIHDLAESMTPIDCLVPRGGILAIRPLIIHASSKSQSEMPRRVLHIEYAVSTKIAGHDLELAIV